MGVFREFTGYLMRKGPLVSGCSLSNNGVASRKTCPHLVLKTGKKTNLFFFSSLAKTQKPGLLGRSGKVFFHWRKMEKSYGLSGACNIISKAPKPCMERDGAI